MKEDLGGFESRLLTELTEVVRDNAAREEAARVDGARTRRGWFTMPRLALGGAVLAAVAAAALVVPALTGPNGGDAAGTGANGAITQPGTGSDTPGGGTGTTASAPSAPVGYSIAVDGDEVTLVVGSLEDEKGLEADMKKEGISTNVTVLQGEWYDCQWPKYEGSHVSMFGGQRSEDGKTTTFHLKRSEFAHGETILIAVYDVRSDDGTGVMKLVGFAVAKSDPGDCVGVKNP